MRSTRELGRAALERSREARSATDPLLDLAPGGVYRAAPVTRNAGGLLHHRFTLTAPAEAAGRSVLCGTVPRVTPGGCYPPPCPVEPGPSSTGRPRRGRPAGSSAASSVRARRRQTSKRTVRVRTSASTRRTAVRRQPSGRSDDDRSPRPRWRAAGPRRGLAWRRRSSTCDDDRVELLADVLGQHRASTRSSTALS